MTIKTTGAEWKRFLDDKAAWDGEMFYEDEEVTVNGTPAEAVDCGDSDVIAVTGGTVFMGINDKDGRSLESHFRKWRKAQSTVFLSVEAPREHADAIKAAIKAAGGKVA